MQSTNIPTKFPIPFASSAAPSYIRTIPTAPTGTVGQASLQLGFPPENFQPVAAGGVPPFGQDFNGLLNQMSAWLQWTQAGGGVPVFDSTFSTAIGGYPQGAFLQALNNPGNFWISLVDNNTVNPDAGASPSNWMAFPQVTILTTARTFYVNSTTGNDSYDGTTATVSGTHGPFATLSRACLEYVKYNLNGNNITINVADGSYTGVSLPQPNGSGNIIWIGNNTNPQNVQVTAAAVTGAGGFVAIYGGNFQIQGFRLSAPSPAYDGIACNAGSITVTGAVRFGPCGRGHMTSGGSGAITLNSGIAITIETGANATWHIGTQAGPGTISIVNPPGGLGFPTLTILGAVTFSGAFVSVSQLGSTIVVYASITGAAFVTGTRYTVVTNGIVQSLGGGVNYYPGTVAGSTATGGQYI